MTVAIRKTGFPLLLALLAFVGLPAVADEQTTDWAETTAEITPFYYESTGHGYTLTYDAPESVAINQEGEPIKGPIDQDVINLEFPVIEQKIQLRYQKDEPILFQLLTEPKIWE